MENRHCLGGKVLWWFHFCDFCPTSIVSRIPNGGSGITPSKRRCNDSSNRLAPKTTSPLHLSHGPMGISQHWVKTKKQSWWEEIICIYLNTCIYLYRIDMREKSEGERVERDTTHEHVSPFRTFHSHLVSRISSINSTVLPCRGSWDRFVSCQSSV